MCTLWSNVPSDSFLYQVIGTVPQMKQDESELALTAIMQERKSGSRVDQFKSLSAFFLFLLFGTLQTNEKLWEKESMRDVYYDDTG